MGDVKILIAGSVRGKLKDLYKRVAAVNKSNGPFDLLLCTGDFFGDIQAAEKDQDILDYLQGSIKVPVQTYYLGASRLSPGSALQILADSSTEGVGPQQRLVYLGSAGIKALASLNVAFLDGPGSQADVQQLQKALQRSSGDVDILLTCPWPGQITECLPAAALAAPPGNEAIAAVGLKARPRYHVASDGNLHWARAPYANKDLGAGSHVTRFIGLGEVGNTAKQKWLHALKLVPAALMAPEALDARPADTTDCPYQSKKRARETDDGGEAAQNWRYEGVGNKRRGGSSRTPGIVKDDAATAFVGNLPYSATEDDVIAHLSQVARVVDARLPTTAEGKPRGFAFVQFESAEAMHQACEALDGSELHKRQLSLRPQEAGHRATPAEAVPNCWFCLSNEQSDKRLVISVGEETYVAMDKGPINDAHVLILPIEHYASGMHMPASAQAEAEAYLKALEACFAAQGKDTVSFERFLHFKKTGGNHAHFNVIAVPPEAGHRAEATFQEAATREDITLQRVPGPSRGDEARQGLRELVRDAEYFVTTLPSGARLAQVVATGQRHPLAFGREVLARLAGVPERADWRACQGSPAEEEDRAAKFVALFKKFDIMQTD